MIRDATDADIPRILAMGRAFADATPYGALMPFDAAQVEALARYLMAEHKVLVACLPDVGTVVGMLALTCLPHPFTGALTVDEVVWWVDPEARALQVGVQLLEHGEEWARAKSVPVVKMVAPTGSAVVRLLERRGYRQVEVTLYKGV